MPQKSPTLYTHTVCIECEKPIANIYLNQHLTRYHPDSDWEVTTTEYGKNVNYNLKRKDKSVKSHKSRRVASRKSRY